MSTIVVVIFSAFLMLFGAWAMRDEDFHPQWRKVIGGGMFMAGAELFHHGLNYLNALP